MKIALVGNQNSGKTTLFNLLTGKNQTVANYPGATVDFFVGTTKGGKETIVDLPGVDSLFPYSNEQEITADYLLHEEIDLIVNVIDATQLEKGLYLTTQLLELDIPLVVALNMIDLLVDQGINLHLKTLERQFGVSFFPISAAKKTGVVDLLCSINANDYIINKTHLWLAFIQDEINEVKEMINTDHSTYYAIKLLEDEDFINDEIKVIQQKIVDKHQEDIYELIAEKRYDYIERALSYSSSVLTKYDKITMKIDKVLLNKYLAIPIFLLIMFIVYTVSVGIIGSAGVDYIEGLFERLQDVIRPWLLSLNASDWSVSLLVDGVIGGVGAMAPFIPQLIVLFFFINILEATGYMTRISYFLDKIFRRFGLSGRALIPFIIGSGCTVPAIASSRGIENKTEREMTIILTPMIPCSAKLPIITVFAGFFFKKYAGLMMFLLYVLSIVIIILSAIILKYVFKVKRSGGYISELPQYRIPKARYVARSIITQVWDFTKNAVTLIVFASIILWFLLSFDFRFNYGIPIEQSMLAKVGHVISYLFYPILGELSWASGVSAIQGFIAKENVIVSMKVIAGVSGEGAIFTSSMFSFFTIASATSFMIFNLFSAPCIASIGAMKAELNSTKKTIYAVLFQTGVAYLLALIAFWLLRMGGL